MVKRMGVSEASKGKKRDQVPRFPPALFTCGDEPWRSEIPSAIILSTNQDSTCASLIKVARVSCSNAQFFSDWETLINWFAYQAHTIMQS